MIRCGSFAALIIVFPLLAACSSTTPAERRAMLSDKCVSYGFRVGTDGHANCIMQTVQADEARSAAASAQTTAMGMQMIMGNQQRPQTCAYNTFGTTVTQTCR